MVWPRSLELTRKWQFTSRNIQAQKGVSPNTVSPWYSATIFRCYSQNCEERLFASSCLSVRPSVCIEQLGFHWRIFMKFDIWIFSKNMSRKLKFHENLTRITGTLHEDRCLFMIISRSFLLTMRNISDKICRENQNAFYVQ